jgi:hypothetical protein
MNGDGAIYVATRDPRYVNLLLGSVASLKRAMPDLPVTLFSQFPVSSPHFERTVQVTTEGDGFYDKARLMLETPYERTLFLDADIYMAQPVPELFQLLDHFDLAVAHEEYLNTDWFGDYARPDIPPSFPEFNTGLMALRRSSQTELLLREWSRLYREFLQQKSGCPINDQPFFRAAAYKSSARIATLGREYNCKFRGQGYVNGPVKVLHGHVKFKMKPAHMQRVLGIMNSSLRPRVYIAGRVYEHRISGRLWGRRKAKLLGSFPEPESVLGLRLRRLRELLQERGWRRLLAKAASVALENCCAFLPKFRPSRREEYESSLPARGGQAQA